MDVSGFDAEDKRQMGENILAYGFDQTSWFDKLIDGLRRSMMLMMGMRVQHL
jgi:hypothetical protein